MRSPRRWVTAVGAACTVAGAGLAQEPVLVPGVPIRVCLPHAAASPTERTFTHTFVDDAWVVLLVDGATDEAVVEFAAGGRSRQGPGDSPTYLGAHVVAGERVAVSLRGAAGSAHRVVLLQFPELRSADRARLDQLVTDLRAAAAASEAGAAGADGRFATGLQQAADLLTATGSHEVAMVIEQVAHGDAARSVHEIAVRHLLAFWSKHLPPEHHLRLGLSASLAVTQANRGDPEGALAACRKSLAEAVATTSPRSWIAQQVRLALYRILCDQGDFAAAAAIAREEFDNWHGSATLADEAWVAAKVDEVWLHIQVGDMAAALIAGEQLEGELGKVPLPWPRHRIRLLGLLADACLALPDLARAQRFARTMLAVVEADAPDDVAAVVDGLMHVCDVLFEVQAEAEIVAIATRACELARDLPADDFMAQWPRLALAEALPLARTGEAIELATRVLASPACRDQDAAAAQYARLVLAKRHRLQGNAAEALAHAQAAHAACLRAPAENHEYAEWACAEMVFAHHDLGAAARARELLLGEIDRLERRLLDSACVVDRRSHESGRQSTRRYLDWLLTTSSPTGSGPPAAAELDAVVRLRAMIDRRSRIRRAVDAAAAADPAIASARNDVRCRARAVERGEAGDTEDAELRGLRAAERAAEDRLLRLVRALPAVAAALERARLPAMLATLGSTDALVVSVAYEAHHRHDRERGSRPAPEGRFALFLAWRGIDGACVTQRFDLGPAAAVVAGCDQLVRRNSGRGRGRDPEAAVDSGADPLGGAFAAPFAALPPTTRTLWICPDGALAAVPWELIRWASPGASPGVLADRCRVRYVESPIAFLRPASHGVAPSLVVFGGIDFDRPPAVPAAAGATNQERRWPALPGSDREAAVAANAFTAANPSARLVWRRGAAATKDEFLANAGGAAFVHLATHAFVTEAVHASRVGGASDGPDRQRPGTTASLVFAGANGHDGALLSERELEWLDFSNCELAVLSACSTNVGARLSGEALAGLNRAAMLAGAANTITSFWPVADDGAADFFTAFYARAWRDGVSVAEAFADARAAVRSRHGPQVWAAFALYETGSPPR